MVFLDISIGPELHWMRVLRISSAGSGSITMINPDIERTEKGTPAVLGLVAVFVLILIAGSI